MRSHLERGKGGTRHGVGHRHTVTERNLSRGRQIITKIKILKLINNNKQGLTIKGRKYSSQVEYAEQPEKAAAMAINAAEMRISSQD